MYIVMYIYIYHHDASIVRYYDCSSTHCGIAMIQYMQQPCALLLHNTCKYECYNIMIEL